MSVRMTIAGFGAPSDGTSRLRNQVAASVVASFHTRFDQQTVNADKKNSLWLTSQQGLFTPNYESLFPHDTSSGSALGTAKV